MSDTLKNRHDITAIDIITFDKGDNTTHLGNKTLTSTLDLATSNELTGVTVSQTMRPSPFTAQTNKAPAG